MYLSKLSLIQFFLNPDGDGDEDGDGDGDGGSPESTTSTSSPESTTSTSSVRTTASIILWLAFAIFTGLSAF